MRRLIPLLALVLALPASAPASAAVAQADTAVPQPEGDIRNVELVNRLPEAAEATSINFLRYGQGRRARDVMIANGRFGLKTYDLSDPADPQLLDELTSDELKLPGDTTGTFWQNEDMDVDQRRKLVFMARDPRAYDGTTSDPDDVAGVYIINARNPRNLRLVEFEELPTGHTTTCVEGCRFLWTGGPASSTEQAEDWPGGRPIFVTDIRNPRRPHTYPDPVDTQRDDGTTAYAHDVQVDARGIAWVSGLGGVRGYWTSGRHYDPVERRRRGARPWDPVPYAGGGLYEADVPSKFLHNSVRPVRGTYRDGGRPDGYRPGDLIYATEERFSADCASDGVFAIANLAGSENGQSWRSSPERPYRLETVGTWSVADKEGSGPTTNCSAHYFELQDGIAAYSWYGQGTRFLDVSDPTDPIQIAYYRPDDGVSWAPYYFDDYIYVADHVRGVEILRLTDDADLARATHTEVLAPELSGAAAANALRFQQRYQRDPQLGWACVLPA